MVTPPSPIHGAKLSAMAVEIVAAMVRWRLK